MAAPGALAPPSPHTSAGAGGMEEGDPVWWDKYEAEQWIAWQGRPPQPLTHPWERTPDPDMLDALADRAEGRPYRPDWKKHLTQEWFYENGVKCFYPAVRNVWGPASGQAYEKRAMVRRLMREWNAAGLPPADLPSRARRLAEAARAYENRTDAAAAELLAAVRDGRLRAYGRPSAKDASGNALPVPAGAHAPIPAEVFADAKLILSGGAVMPPGGFARLAREHHVLRRGKAIYPLYVNIHFRAQDVRQLCEQTPLEQAALEQWMLNEAEQFFKQYRDKPKRDDLIRDCVKANSCRHRDAEKAHATLPPRLRRTRGERERSQIG